MRLRKFTKDPDERKRYGIDYTSWLDTSEQITGINLAVTGSDNTLVANTSSVSPDGKKIVFFVQGGTSGKQYSVHTTITTSVGQVREDTIPFVVLSL